MSAPSAPSSNQQQPLRVDTKHNPQTSPASITSTISPSTPESPLSFHEFMIAYPDRRSGSMTLKRRNAVRVKRPGRQENGLTPQQIPTNRNSDIRSDSALSYVAGKPDILERPEKSATIEFDDPVVRKRNSSEFSYTPGKPDVLDIPKHRSVPVARSTSAFCKAQ
ncbi:hypothetical protein P280DRAFT_515295 [Massarina eburnea CBS 473.64]|uniref:Uncharacterized protein n=1 Tax=Massarina eburnea CBS 473.64 TaxID=1395130 RepID=A0A6A6SBZ3_9PLEO|nr:hypothetical protein P280DRAFT_515295 [Massarina eburnea CBS 473.64]